MPSITIPIGSDVQAALNAHPASGTTFVLPRGGSWVLSSPLYPQASGVTIKSDGNLSKSRPKLSVKAGQGVQLWHKQDISLADLEITNLGPPTATGIDITACANVGLAYIDLHGFTFGIVANGGANNTGGFTRCNGLSLYSCMIHDNYNPHGMCSGMFASGVDGLVVDSSVFHTNGWQPGNPEAVATIFNHGVYVCADSGPATITNNGFINNAATGIEARTGGHVASNLFVDNPLQITYGLVNGGGPSFIGGVSGDVTGNVMIGGRDINGQKRGIPITLGNILKATVTSNLIAQDNQNASTAIQVAVCSLDANVATKPIGIQDLTFADNAVWDWPQGPYWQDHRLVKGGAGDFSLGQIKLQTLWAPPKPGDLRTAIGGADAIVSLKSLAVTPAQLIKLAMAAAGR